MNLRWRRQHKTNLWKEHLAQHWDHRQNTHVLWKTIAGLSNKKPAQTQINSIIFNKKIATTTTEKANFFIKQYTNTVQHKTRPSNRQTDRQVSRLPTSKLEITVKETIMAIQQSKIKNSAGPDNINIRHLKHLGGKALEYLTRLFNQALNRNVIPAIWKTAKIIPILKPNKDPNNGASFRPISLLSTISKTLEKILLPKIVPHMPKVSNQHGYKNRHSTVTALHEILDRVTAGFNKKAPPRRSVIVALDMSKAFDTVHLHRLIDKLCATTAPPVIIKFLANYLKGRHAFVKFGETHSKMKLFKSGVPQGGVLSPILFNLYTSDLPKPPPGVHVTIYADDITITASDVDYMAAQRRIQPYLRVIEAWTQENDLQINPAKTTTTLCTPDPAEYSKTLSLEIDGTLLPTVQHPKILGLVLDPKLTFNEHVKAVTKKASATIKILKALTSTNWGKQKETIVSTYKVITRPILEYASTVWSPVLSSTQQGKLQITQNMALRTGTGCTMDTNINHLHDETKVLPINYHLRLHASQLRQKTQNPAHPLHHLTRHGRPPRLMKSTIFHNQDYTINKDTDPAISNDGTVKINMKTIHTAVVQEHLRKRPPNTLLGQQAPDIVSEETGLDRPTRRTLAQLRAGKCPLLRNYLHKIKPDIYKDPTCPLCKTAIHDCRHLFNCAKVPTGLNINDLWTKPKESAALVSTWIKHLESAKGSHSS